MSTADAMICPLCNSAGISATVRESIGLRHVRITARCGQCGTWRVLVLTRSAARAFDRCRRRDRRHMKRSLRRARRLGFDVGAQTLDAPARPASPPAR